MSDEYADNWDAVWDLLGRDEMYRLLRRALEAIETHRDYDGLRRKGKPIPTDHEVWKRMAKAQETWADLKEMVGEK